MRANPGPRGETCARRPRPLTSVKRVMKMKAPAESGQASWSQILRTWPKQATTSTAEELCFSCRTGSNWDTSTETTAIDSLSRCPPSSKCDHYHLIHLHSFTDSVAGSVVNDLQPLVDGRLEPVMEACQGQHLGVPVREETGKTCFPPRQSRGKG